MQINITSDILKVKIGSFGAELHSVMDHNDTEYLWQADERVWKRHAPVLFPFVCNTASKKYTVNGAEYAMSNHGFARDSEFELLFAKENSAEFYLGSSEETLKQYPYKFGLYVNYTLDGSRLKVTYTVENKDDKQMYFFVGGHPAFRCPIGEKESYGDYTVVYEKNETIVQERPDGTSAVILDNGSKVPVSHELFAHDVFMKDKPRSSWVALVSKAHDYKVKLHYDNGGCIAVWSSWFEDKDKTDMAQFVCLEPWSSEPVYCSREEEITKMSGAKSLAPGEKYVFTYTIEIGG
ncbi:MAG: aldose 1-epimerase family protein [Oscillospiraceae bacterium]